MDDAITDQKDRVSPQLRKARVQVDAQDPIAECGTRQSTSSGINYAQLKEPFI